MPSYAFSKGNIVSYNGEYCRVFRLMGTSSPTYLLRNINSGASTQDVAESSLSAVNVQDVVAAEWANFTYTGDNGAASNFCKNLIVKCIDSAQVGFSHNSDNTVYTLTVNDTTYTKNVS